MPVERADRRSIRLDGYDYTRPGAYFVTICSYRRMQVFGKVRRGNIRLSSLGVLVQDRWSEIPEHFEGVTLDAFVVMPNHLHGILHLENRRGTIYRAPTEAFGIPVPGALSTIVRSFKGAVTRQWRRLTGAPDFNIWQRNYYEHVIRNEAELGRIRSYIIQNPFSWHEDQYFTQG